MNIPFFAALSAFGLSGLLVLGGVFSLGGVKLFRAAFPARVRFLGAVGCLAVIGYASFWVYFANPFCGRIFSWLIVIAICWGVVRSFQADRLRENKLRDPDCYVPMLVVLLIGVFYLGLLYLFGGESFYYLGSHRFAGAMPGDNALPDLLAQRLWLGISPKPFGGDWLSSDRPPLQAGWILLFHPTLRLLFDSDTVGGCMSFWFQLLWVPAAWAMLRELGASLRQASVTVACLSCTGFLLVNTVFTWPKLAAAAFLLAAFLCFFNRTESSTAQESRLRFVAGGGLMGLAFLSHGGAAFSILILALLALIDIVRQKERWLNWVFAAACFIVLLLPWSAYQKFFDPPGDRLLKWHLAGQIPPDTSRGLVPILVQHYKEVGWKGAWANRQSNIRVQSDGSYLFVTKPWAHGFAPWSRTWEFFTTSGTLGCWLICLPLLLWFLSPWANPPSLLRSLVTWWIFGWLLWVFAMFGERAAIVHQGTYITQIVGLALLAWLAWRVHWALFALIAILQISVFTYVWLPASTPPPVPPLMVIPLVFTILAALGLVLVAIKTPRETPLAPAAAV